MREAKIDFGKNVIGKSINQHELFFNYIDSCTKSRDKIVIIKDNNMR